MYCNMHDIICRWQKEIIELKLASSEDRWNSRTHNRAVNSFMGLLWVSCGLAGFASLGRQRSGQNRQIVPKHKK